MTKGPEAFRTISEASDELGVPQHVLRFWETRFSFIRPMKRAGGRRFYRPRDIAILRGLRVLLHDEGHSIKAVQRLHRQQGLKRLLAAGSAAQDVVLEMDHPAESVPPPDARPRARRTPADLSDIERRRLKAALQDLTAIKAEIDALLAQNPR